MKQRHGYVATSTIWLLVLCTFTAAGYAAARGIKVLKITDNQGQEVGLYRQSHALVIGVSDYSEGWPRLPGVQKDVKAVSATLKGHGFNVEIGVGKHREYNNRRKALSKEMSPKYPGKREVIYQGNLCSVVLSLIVSEITLC